MKPPKEAILCFSIGPRLLGVEIGKVRELFRELPRTPIPRTPPEVLGLANVRGQVVTVLDLAPLLGWSEGARGSACLLLKPLQGEEEVFALAIDRPGDILEIVEGQWMPPPANLPAEEVPFVLGLTDSPDGLVTILDPRSLHFASSSGESPALRRQGA